MTSSSRPARVLAVAGSDSGGGAGIQADIKTIAALGGYAMTAITALTAQNTLGVQAVHPVPPAFVAQQMHLVLEDIGADAIKIGMLMNAGIIEAVSTVLAEYPGIPVILDTVMLAKGGATLLEKDAFSLFINKLAGKALVITPNVPEAELLLEYIGKPHPTHCDEDMRQAAKQLLALGSQAVLLKGGHRRGDSVTDILALKGCSREGGQLNPAGCDLHSFSSPRIHTRHTHGTGCTLASAIATLVAQGYPIYDAVDKARHYVQKAILHAPGLGQGHGPLNHFA